MSSVAPPPNPCLVAIILIVRSRAGPRLVFHYPPNPLADGQPTRRASGGDDTSVNDSITSSDDEDSSSEDDDNATAGGSVSRKHGQVGENESQVSSTHTGVKKGRNPDEDEDDNSPERMGEEGYKPPWETVLGFGTEGLEKLLSPSRMWHKRRFEVGMNELAFIGWPVFVREDGTWQKQKKRKKKRKDREGSGGEIGHEEAMNTDGVEVKDMLEEASGDDVAVEEQRGASTQEMSDGTKAKDEDSSAEIKKGKMSMFNVVFVLDPPILEYSLRIKEMYDHVLKKFVRALKWEQARVDYVWKEAKMILSLKDKAKENKTTLSNLYSDLLSSSSLARAISSVYTAISTSRIASVHLTPAVSISLQIPPVTSTSILPSATDTQLPGLWLTTADSVTSADDASTAGTPTPTQQLAKHFALLLLDNEANILKDISDSAGTLGPPLAHYIRSSKPTKSFAQISALSSIPLADIQQLARHLVYWRRARAVPPLNQRDTYIVSPNADLRKLASATASYSATFPTLPSLPKMLNSLSGPPRPYQTLIPSKDHKEAYYMILAWLLRGGWVTQLRTFAWVRVDARIKMEVGELLEKEEVERKKSGSENINGGGSSHSSSNPSSSSTAIQSKAANGLLHPARHPSQTTASLILHPHRASPIESRWLDHLLTTFPEPNNSEDASDDLRHYWPVFTKYFNGHDALEKIPVREGLKRNKVWEMLGRMGLLSPALGFGPPDGDGGEGEERRVLVGVRHW